MIEDIQLRGRVARTREMYVIAVRQVAKHCGKSPDLITLAFLKLANPGVAFPAYSLARFI